MAAIDRAIELRLDGADAFRDPPATSGNRATAIGAKLLEALQIKLGGRKNGLKRQCYSPRDGRLMPSARCPGRAAQ